MGDQADGGDLEEERQRVAAYRGRREEAGRSQQDRAHQGRRDEPRAAEPPQEEIDDAKERETDRVRDQLPRDDVLARDVRDAALQDELKWHVPGAAEDAVVEERPVDRPVPGVARECEPGAGDVVDVVPVGHMGGGDQERREGT